MSEPARRGDRWLLTSDGLTDYVPILDVAETLAAAATPQEAADALIALALMHQARDNVSVVVADVVELPETPVYRPAFGGSAASDPASSRAF
ncbi:hypothetical protein ACRAWC_19685 [Leifsonia sp. L25]|uniref:hypothetical protein n=1 Tax=Actinomycetes TaxID=1760 RepID=UPI003D693946